MNNKHLYIRVLIIVCFSTIFVSSFSVSVMGGSLFKDVKRKARSAIKKTEDAVKKTTNIVTGKDAKWYSDYQEGKKAAEKGDWTTAIKLFKKAIEQEPKPKTWRVKGVEGVIGYYPYLKLGMAYLTIGDIEAAQHYCEQSKEKGVAPKESVDECLASVAQHTGNKQIVKLVPTPTPSSISPSQPLISAPQPDTLPIIVVKPEIPAETESEILTIEGTAVDDHGITEVNVSVRKAETRAIIAVNRVQITQEQFKTAVLLEIGQNEIIIEATDTIGQVGRSAFTVLRKSPEQPDATGARAGSIPMPEVSADSTQQPRNVYAVIIGIGDYQDERIPDLRFTVNDALGMYDVLIDHQYGGVPEDQIQLLLDEDATARNVRSAIGTWLRRQTGEDDTVLIYYAGHGASEEGKAYWVTHDADIDDLFATALRNNTISEMLDDVASKRVITFLDSCYSAATVKRKDRTRAIIVKAPLEKFTGEGRVVISASNGEQLSLEMEAYEHGVFTYYLLEGLKGEADGTTAEERDGIVEIEEIWNYVRNQVTDTAKKKGNTQTPKFQGSLTAGFPLTYDRAYLEEMQRRRLQAIREKLAKLQELFEQRLIPPALFDCAFQMLDAGKSDGYLDGLLSGEISPKTFGRLFKCDSQQ